MSSTHPVTEKSNYTTRVCTNLNHWRAVFPASMLVSGVRKGNDVIPLNFFRFLLLMFLLFVVSPPFSLSFSLFSVSFSALFSSFFHHHLLFVTFKGEHLRRQRPYGIQHFLFQRQDKISNKLLLESKAHACT